MNAKRTRSALLASANASLVAPYVPPSEPPIRLIQRRTVLDRTGSTDGTLRRWINDGEFPAPIELPGRRVAWIESEVNAWIAERVAGNRQVPKRGGAASSSPATSPTP